MLMSTVRSGTLVLAKIKRLSCLHSRTAINHLSTNADYKPIKSVLVANRGNAIYFQLSYLLTVFSHMRPWGIIFFIQRSVYVDKCEGIIRMWVLFEEIRYMYCVDHQLVQRRKPLLDFLENIWQMS